jgi:hypothetical protein
MKALNPQSRHHWRANTGRLSWHCLFGAGLWLLLLLSSCAHTAEGQAALAPDSSQRLSRAGLGALEHASNLVAAINRLDWGTVKSSVSTQVYYSFDWLTDRADRQKENWPGLGGYLGFEYDPATGNLKLRFVLEGARNSPHEAWFIYSICDDNFTFRRFDFLGW